MGIFASLNNGISGLKASELQIATTGNNITNANSTFYTRQRAVQTTAGFYNTYNNVEVGMGTTIESIVRLHDEYSYSKLKDATTQLEYSSYMKTKLEEIAKRFPDIKESGVLKDLENYNAAWNSFSSNPNDGATKENLVKVTKTLTESLNKTFADIDKYQQSINEDIYATVDEINRIGEEIAYINKQLSAQEVLNTDRANQLRDKRDELELTLSKLVEGVASKHVIQQDSRLDSTITDTAITDSGRHYNLTLHGHVLVDGSSFSPLKIITDEVSGSNKIVYQGWDEKIVDLTTELTGGKLGAQLDLRGRTYDKKKGAYDDGIIQGYKDTLDTFAKTLITHTNNIYASSAKSSLSSDSFSKLGSNVSLMGYDKNVQVGTFDIVIYDQAGQKVGTKTINVDVNTTMEDIVRQINSNTDDNNDNNSNNDIDDYLQATFNYDGKTESGLFQINLTDPRYKVAIEDHGSNFAGAFNIGGFFSGYDASSIRVKQEIQDDPTILKASKNGTDGDNDISNAIVQLQYDKINFYNKDGTVDTKSLDDYYRKFTGGIAADGEQNNNQYNTHQTLYNSVYEEFQSLNGVNTNEELASLIQYQTSYGAASKVITTIDQMLDTLLSLKS